jgi:hypothetical protein
MAISKRFLQPINLLNAASDPSSADTGDFYYNTTTKRVRNYNGTSWTDVGTTTRVSTTAPTIKDVGDGWFDNVNGSFYIYDGTYWVEVTSMMIVGLDADPAPLLNADLDANSYNIIDIDKLTFDESPESTLSQASIRWNATDGTFEIGMPNSVGQSVGMESFLSPVNNDSGVSIPVGSFVMKTGVSGGQLTVAKAVTDGTINPREMLGIAAHTITSGMTTGLIMTDGVISGIDTSTWTAGTTLYPNSSVAGGLTSTQPTAPAIRIPVAVVLTQNASTGKILVKITASSVLGGTDSNVKFTSLIDNDVVSYDSALGVWINKQPTGGGGGASITVSDTPPGSPSAGQMWFNSANGKMYLYYDSYWVEVGSSSQSGAVSTDVALSNSWWPGV